MIFFVRAFVTRTDASESKSLGTTVASNLTEISLFFLGEFSRTFIFGSLSLSLSLSLSSHRHTRTHSHTPMHLQSNAHTHTHLLTHTHASTKLTLLLSTFPSFMRLKLSKIKIGAETKNGKESHSCCGQFTFEVKKFNCRSILNGTRTPHSLYKGYRDEGRG